MYTLLSIITLVICYLSGKIASSQKAENGDYWKFMTWPIISYALLYGLRDGWLIDYFVYEDVYKHLSDNVEKLGWLTYLIFYCGKYIGLHYNFILTILNASLMACFCGIVKPYKEKAHIILPLFYFVSMMTANFIAFYPAIGALTLAMALHLQCDNKYDIRHLWHNKLWLPILLVLIAFGYHKAAVLGLVFYAIVLVVDFNPIFVIFIYGLSYFFDTNQWFNILNVVSLYLSFGDDSGFSIYEHYITNADNIFEIKENTRTIWSHLRIFIANSAAIWLFYKWRIDNKVDNSKCKILELSAIALILTKMTAGLAVFSRYALLMNVFIPIQYAYAITYGLKSRKSTYNILAWIIIVFIGWEYFCLLFFINNADYPYLSLI